MEDDIDDLIGDKIGQGLVKMGEMTEKQVDLVLKHQKDGDDRIFGEIAVHLGYTDLDAVIRYIEQSFPFQPFPS